MSLAEAVRRVVELELAGQAEREVAMAQTLLRVMFAEAEDSARLFGLEDSYQAFTGTLRDVVNRRHLDGREPFHDDVVGAVRDIYGGDERLRGFMVIERGRLGRWHCHGVKWGPRSVLVGTSRAWHERYGFQVSKDAVDVLGWARYAMKEARHAMKGLGSSSLGSLLLLPDCEPF